MTTIMTEREEGKLEEKMNTLEKGITTVTNIAREIRDDVRSNYVSKTDLNVTVLEIGKQISEGLTGLRQSLETMLDAHIIDSNQKVSDLATQLDRMKTSYRAVIGFLGSVLLVFGVLSYLNVI